MSVPNGRLYSPHQTCSSDARLADDELVLRGARGVLARVDDDRAAADDPPLAAERDLLVERLGRQVPVDAARVREAVVLEPVVARELPRLAPARAS